MHDRSCAGCGLGVRVHDSVLVERAEPVTDARHGHTPGGLPGGVVLNTVHLIVEQVLEVEVFQQGVFEMDVGLVEFDELAQTSSDRSERCSDDLLRGTARVGSVEVGQVMGHLDRGDKHVSKERLVVCVPVSVGKFLVDKRILSSLAGREALVIESDLLQIVDALIDDLLSRHHHRTTSDPRRLNLHVRNASQRDRFVVAEDIEAARGHEVVERQGGMSHLVRGRTQGVLERFQRLIHHSPLLLCLGLALGQDVSSAVTFRRQYRRQLKLTFRRGFRTYGFAVSEAHRRLEGTPMMVRPNRCVSVLKEIAAAVVPNGLARRKIRGSRTRDGLSSGGDERPFLLIASGRGAVPAAACRGAGHVGADVRHHRGDAS